MALSLPVGPMVAQPDLFSLCLARFFQERAGHGGVHFKLSFVSRERPLLSDIETPDLHVLAYTIVNILGVKCERKVTEC